jgi:hypothetical protein
VLAAIAERGLAELDSREWDRCVLAADVQGGVAARALSRTAGARLAGLALGHATLSYRRQGPRAPLSPEVDATIPATRPPAT